MSSFTKDEMNDFYKNFKKNPSRLTTRIHNLIKQKNIKVLDLSGLFEKANPNTSALLSCIAQAIRNTKVTIVNFSFNNLPIQIIIDFMTELRETEVDSFSFSHNALSTLDAVQIMNQAEGTKIVHIGFDNNHINDINIEQLVLSYMKTRIRFLYLPNNNIGSQGAISIIKHLKHSNINVIDLSGNKLGNTGTIEFLKQLKYTNVTQVSVASNDILSESGIELANAIRGSKLVNIDIADSGRLDSTSEDLIEDALKYNATLNNLHFAYSKIKSKVVPPVEPRQSYFRTFTFGTGALLAILDSFTLGIAYSATNAISTYFGLGLASAFSTLLGGGLLAGALIGAVYLVRQYTHRTSRTEREIYYEALNTAKNEALELSDRLDKNQNSRLIDCFSKMISETPKAKFTVGGAHERMPNAPFTPLEVTQFQVAKMRDILSAPKSGRAQSEEAAIQESKKKFSSMKG